ncbi:molybdenum cofactor guanylyltransferase [Bacillus spongiae]|uniref:Probable molybdenum cofactor guanylyltransferase n=1 Tax=Bacillus spongiae TaxID=2683610 RepID=A0ABU8HDF8_9BACI
MVKIMTADIIGVVMAGGKSTRFGSDKAFALYQGTPLYEYSIKTLTEVVNKTVMVTNDNLLQTYRDKTDLEIKSDLPPFQNCGPLGGLYTALTSWQADWYLVLPIDVPLMNKRMLQRMLAYIDGKVDAVVPVIHTKKQPLIAVYHFTVKDILREQLNKQDYQVTNFLDKLSVRYLDEQDGENSFFHNINTQMDYKMYLS